MIRSSRHRQPRRWRRLLPIACIASVALAYLAPAAPASAAESAAHFELEAAAYPTSFSSDDCPAGRETTNCDQFRITAYSTGELTTSGQVTLTDELPDGLVIQAPLQLVRIPVARDPEVLPVK